MTSFKIYIGDEIRRFRLESKDLSYEKFVEKLRDNIPKYHLEMKTYYEDSDKDRIVFSSEPEFTEMLSCFTEASQEHPSVIRIWITDSNQPYFKDGTVEIIKLYAKGRDQIEQVVNSENVSSVQEKITAAVSRLFPNNAILPYNIPSYLKEVLSVKINGTADVEVDVAVENLTESLNNEALRLMDSDEECDLHKSKLLLESLQILDSENPNVYYNLACVNSLLKNVQSSIELLQEAINKGYSNFKHMLEDNDLADLRIQSQFQELVKSVLPDVENKHTEVIEEKQVNAESTNLPQSDVPTEQPKAHEKWGDEIEVLKGMGFDLEESVFVAVLDHHKGNVEGALSALI